MAFEDRRERERAARRQLIITTARRVAEAEGWEAVTTRRLSAEIEYSQPVLYKHFAGLDHIADAIAVEGFAELTEVLRAAQADEPADVLAGIAHAYLKFARGNPAVYDAMFTRATNLRFASPETPAELATAFAELHRVVVGVAGGRDADLLTEMFWAALHGLVTLGRAGRLRPGHDDGRVRLLVDQFSGGGEATRRPSAARRARR